MIKDRLAQMVPPPFAGKLRPVRIRDYATGEDRDETLNRRLLPLLTIQNALFRSFYEGALKRVYVLLRGQLHECSCAFSEEKTHIVFSCVMRHETLLRLAFSQLDSVEIGTPSANLLSAAFAASQLEIDADNIHLLCAALRLQTEAIRSPQSRSKSTRSTVTEIILHSLVERATVAGAVSLLRGVA